MGETLITAFVAKVEGTDGCVVTVGKTYPIIGLTSCGNLAFIDDLGNLEGVYGTAQYGNAGAEEAGILDYIRTPFNGSSN